MTTASPACEIEVGSVAAEKSSAQPSAAEVKRAAEVQQSEWPQSAAIITGEVMGTGLLSLPYACAKLGWAVGISSCVLFGVASNYSGWLLSTCKNKFHPQAEGYGDLADATGGAHFGAFTRAAMLLTWGLLLPYFIIACVDSLLIAFPARTECFWPLGLGIALVLVAPLQLRSFHLLSYLSAASTGAIIVVVVVMVPTLLSSAPAAPVTSVGLPGGQGALEIFSYFGSFVFAFQGQSIFLEIMREMKTPAHFPRALLAANSLMVVVYTSVVVAAYGSHGGDVQSFLPATLPPGPARVAIGLLLTFHTLVCYLIAGQPLHRRMHAALFPQTVDAAGPLAQAHWAAITLSTLLAAYVLANAIPFFNDLQGLLGSLTGTPIVFGTPDAVATSLTGAQLPASRHPTTLTDWRAN